MYGIDQILRWFISLLFVNSLFSTSLVLAVPVDLKVTQITISPRYPSLKRGETNISVTVKNIGSRVPSMSSSLNMGIWSVNENGARTNGTNIPMLFPSYSRNIPRLPPGRQITFSKSLTFQHAGRHRVEAWITTEGFAAEEERASNNFQQRYFEVRDCCPDLVVYFKEYNRAPPFARSTFPVKIRNIDTSASAPCDLRFRIQKKGIKHYAIPALTPGEVYGIQRSVYLGSQNNFNFSLRIDFKNQVAETPEGEYNNIMQGTICTAPSCLPNTRIRCTNQ